MQKNKSTPTNSFPALPKTLLVSAAIGFAVMLILSVTIAVGIANIKRYESFYPIVTVLLQFVPGFVSAKITSKRYSHSLLLLAILQAAAVALLLFAFSIIWFKGKIDINLYLLSLIYVFISSFLGCIFSGKKRKKIKRT